jgi:hypothetical protein
LPSSSDEAVLVAFGGGFHYYRGVAADRAEPGDIDWPVAEGDSMKWYWPAVRETLIDGLLAFIAVVVPLTLIFLGLALLAGALMETIR